MNIAVALKSEISRVTRKELRSETKTLKKASSQYRADIAALKRRIAELEKMLKSLARATSRSSNDAVESPPETKVRFSAKSIAAQRRRLNLSASDFGALIGVSSQTIYHWEQGKSRPRDSQIPAMLAVRKMGKREAAAKLADLS